MSLLIHTGSERTDPSTSSQPDILLGDLHSVAIAHARLEQQPQALDIASQLTEAGLLETYVDEDGQEAMRLTPKGAQLGRAMAMAGEDVDPEVMLEELLQQG